ncbi:hypothetical protein C5167_004281 [Papaver somniferum]|nr:hypothetical protein C5167_004281 [Papaver somniferum]
MDIRFCEWVCMSEKFEMIVLFSCKDDQKQIVVDSLKHSAGAEPWVPCINQKYNNGLSYDPLRCVVVFLRQWAFGQDVEFSWLARNMQVRLYPTKEANDDV